MGRVGQPARLAISTTAQPVCAAVHVRRFRIFHRHPQRYLQAHTGKLQSTITTDPTDPNTPLYGQHENLEYYQQCSTRNRNTGLFTADQNLQGTTAIYTRQNNNGDRHGFECTEERDYYPYWHPSPWRDIWVCTDTPTQCQMYQDNSQNVANKGNCSNPLYNTEKT